MCEVHDVYQNYDERQIIHLYAAFANNITQQLTTIQQKTTSY